MDRSCVTRNIFGIPAGVEEWRTKQVKREEERKKEKRRERDYCCIVTANALPIHFAYYRMQIAKRDCRGRKGGNRLFELGVVSVWWLTENKFRPVSNSTDPRAITSPMFRIGRRGNPGCECKTKASHYEIKPPATRSVHSKINRNRFPSFSPILGEKSIALPIVIGVRRLENSRE